MKKTALFAGLLVSAALLATACGKKEEAAPAVTSEIPVIASETVVEEVETESTGAFDSMIDALEDGKYYGLLDLNGKELLLVADSTFDDGGKQESDSAYIYTIGADGAAVLCGQVVGGGTAYPVSFSTDYIYYGNRAGITKVSLADDNTLVEEEGTEDEFMNALPMEFTKKGE